MIGDEANISAVETFYNAILDGDISENVFPSTLPPKIDSMNDMVVISCDTGINNYNAYAGGYVELWLYAKPMSSGKKNVALMSKMEKRLNEIIKEQAGKNPHYTITRDESRTDYDSARNLHVNIVRIYTLIT